MKTSMDQTNQQQIIMNLLSDDKKVGLAAKPDARPIALGEVKAPDKRRLRLSGKRYVFTAAQNNTYVHEKFFKSLMHFCKERNAELVISAITYNKNGFQNQTKNSDKVWFDPSVEPFITNDSLQVCSDLVFCGELDILPTAADPLSGFENYTQSCSGIIPHTKVQMRSLPRMKNDPPRFMYTTGAITLRNYIQRKAGQKAEFHHVFGALYVEIDANGQFFARQLISDEDGVFHDLTDKFTPDGVVPDQPVIAITWGDIHVEKMDARVMLGAWGDGGSMLNVLKPSIQFLHDLTDFRARNHHNIRDPHFIASMHNNGTSNVEKDLKRCGLFLQYITRTGTQAVVVDSNHDQALVRWLKDADIHKDPENAEFFHRANMHIYQAIQSKQKFNVFEWAVTAAGTLKSNSVFLQEDDSFVLLGIEHGLHGHRGPNGSRGTPRSFRSIGRKVNIGHMHSAGIFDGVYVAGVSAELDMGYNKGPSSWSHSHVLTYANGKRSIITMRNEQWKA